MDMEDEDVEAQILQSCNQLLLCSSSSSWPIAQDQLQSAVQVAGPRASSVLLRFLRQPLLPDHVLDALAQAIAQCCGSCSAPASTRTFTFSPSLSVQVKEMDYVKGGLGWKVWGTALLLSWKLIDLQKSIHGKRVLELGSGCGLCGLLAAKLGAAEAVLSDCVPEIVANLCNNASLLSANSCLHDPKVIEHGDDGHSEVNLCHLRPCFDYTFEGATLGIAPDAYACLVRVRLLDWLEDAPEASNKFLSNNTEDPAYFPKLGNNDKFDWVIGSDLIYDRYNLQSLAGVIHRRLSNVNGRGLFAGPIRAKADLDFFLKELDQLGMAALVDHCDEEEWSKCMVALGAIAHDEGTVHGIDHYEGGIVVISVTQKGHH